MNRILTGALLSFLAVFSGSNALAEQGLGMEVEVRGGHNYSKWDKGKNKFQTNEVRLGASKQLGELPVSLGLSVGKTNVVALQDELGRFEGYDVSAEAKAWLPEKVTGSENFKPFVRVAHTVYSDTEIRGFGEKLKGKDDGLTAGIGAAYNLTDSTAASLEYSYKCKTMDIKGLGKDPYKSHGVALGLAHSI